MSITVMRGQPCRGQTGKTEAAAEEHFSAAAFKPNQK